MQIPEYLFIDMAGRKRKNVGRLPKSYEKKIQSTGKYKRGRPSKISPQPVIDTQSTCARIDLPWPTEQPTRTTGTSEHRSIQLPTSWSAIHSDDSAMKYYKVSDCGSCMKFTHSLTVERDGSWAIYIHDTLIDPSHSTLIDSFSARS